MFWVSENVDDGGGFRMMDWLSILYAPRELSAELKFTKTTILYVGGAWVCEISGRSQLLLMWKIYSGPGLKRTPVWSVYNRCQGSHQWVIRVYSLLFPLLTVDHRDYISFLRFARKATLSENVSLPLTARVQSRQTDRHEPYFFLESPKHENNLFTTDRSQTRFAQISLVVNGVCTICVTVGRLWMDYWTFRHFVKIIFRRRIH